MRGVHEEGFEGLEYHQGACIRTLTFGSFSFIAFLSKFFPFIHPFSLSVLLPFLLFLIWFFIALCFPPSFSPLFFGFSSLAYSNLLGTKRLGCCCIKRRTISAAEATITPHASKTCHRRLRCASEGSPSMGERAKLPDLCHVMVGVGSLRSRAFWPQWPGRQRRFVTCLCEGHTVLMIIFNCAVEYSDL
jgi:hypothetical protein